MPQSTRLRDLPLLRLPITVLLLAILSINSLALKAAEPVDAAKPAAKPVAKQAVKPVAKPAAKVSEVTKPADADAAKADDAKEGDAKAGDADPTSTDVAAGHSYHGEAFNEGPRQAAYLMEGMPNVTFPATCKNEQVQKFINQGVGQLHGFWYFEAERSFRQAASLDPDCAVAYLGMAMSNGGNLKRAKGFIAEAVKRKSNVTERERMYIEAFADYVNTPKTPTKKDKERREKWLGALTKIIKKFPDDLEAKAFWAVYRWSSKSRVSLKTDKEYAAVNGMIQKVLDVNPMHPCHHYRIHLWDYKDAKKALASSALCGQSGAGIAHMWHMPGHIFSRLNRFNDAAWQQEASARVDHAHMMRDHVLPDQIHNFAHNNEWLCRNLTNVGRITDAIELAKNMTELPRHPKYNTLSKRRGSASYGRMRLYEVLEKYDLWDRMLALMDEGYLEKTGDNRRDLKRLRMRGLAAFYTDQPKLAEPIINDLQSRLAKVQAEQDAAGTKAYGPALKKAKSDEVKAKAKAKADAEKKAAANKVKAEKAKAEKIKAEKARAAVKEVATPKVQKKVQEKVQEKPGDKPAEKKLAAPVKPAAKPTAKPVAKPKPKAKKPAKKQTPEQIANKAKTDARRKFDSRVNELAQPLAELSAFAALARGDKAEAAKQIGKAGGTPNYRKARFYGQLGDWKKAEEFAKKEADSRKHRVQPLADYAYALHKAGKKKEAKEKLEELRKLSDAIEMASPVFTRINEVAKAHGIKGDWRIKKPLAKDIGKRPDQDKLGPFRWQPLAATNWKLPDSNNRSISLSDYRGKNVIVIFYLGADCIHCTEQLTAFAPEAKKFKAAGIDIIGISTDNVLNLKRSLEPVKSEGGYAFPLVSNAGLDVFKQYRCYDDFEKLTLHGTFLIDKTGVVRWQDISYEPFTDVKFLLAESQRLLKQKVNKSVVTR